MTNAYVDQIAPVQRRVIAFVIDAAITAGITGLVSVLAVLVVVFSGSAGERLAPLMGLLVWLVLVAWLLTYTAMQGGRGSFGMRFQRIRMVRDDGGRELGFGKALLRNIIFGLTANIIVGYFTVLLDKSGRSQGWHDKVSGALMVETISTTKSAPPTDIMNTTPPLPVPSRSFASAPAAPAPVAPTLATPPAAAPAAPATDAAPEQTVLSPPRPSAPAFPVVPSAPAAAPALGSAPASAPAPAGAPAPATSAASGSGLIAFVPGVTQQPPAKATPAPAPEPAPAEVPAAAPANAAPAAEPEAAELEEDVESTRISIPGHRLVFTWDDGTRTEVSKRTVFGRNPEPDADAQIVTVRDETLSLSKTHFEAGAESAGGWVMDRHSTNGMIIVRGGDRIVCTPGEKVRVQLGDAIEIGDRIVTIGGYV